jgi:hypothetical protein
VVQPMNTPLHYLFIQEPRQGVPSHATYGVGRAITCRPSSGTHITTETYSANLTRQSDTQARTQWLLISRTIHTSYSRCFLSTDTYLETAYDINIFPIIKKDDCDIYIYVLQCLATGWTKGDRGSIPGRGRGFFL